MVVRIRVKTERAATPLWRPIFANLLGVSAALGLLAGFWILASGPHWVGEFPVTRGLFSHWQIWVAYAVMAQLGAFRLNRRNRLLIS